MNDPTAQRAIDLFSEIGTPKAPISTNALKV